MPRAAGRVAELQEHGVDEAYIYGDRAVGGTGGLEGLNAFFILTAPPEVYNLPDQPELPQDKTLPAMLTTAGAAILFGVAAILSLRRK
jgi:formate dehydrogenase iron-sulfur subunit